MQHKILIVGADGMLGNLMYNYLKKDGYDVFGTVRKKSSDFIFYEIKKSTLLEFKNIVSNMNISVIINCASINNVSESNFEESIVVNSIFPNYVSRYIASYSVKFIHISTNGFYSDKGNNTVNSDPFFPSLYSISKFLGEWNNKYTLSIRASIIGYNPNKSQGSGLLNWFLDLPNKHTIKGYTNVLWNGITTLTLARFIKLVLSKPNANGVINISSETISKYDLLQLFRLSFNKNVTIIKDNTIASDQTIISSPEQAIIKIPSLDYQIEELKVWYNL